jgi:hypothetical protein
MQVNVNIVQTIVRADVVTQSSEYLSIYFLVPGIGNNE